jgi:hypothetical protein
MQGAALTQRQIVLDAMSQRPADPWPRWQGHVVLGIPGSPRSQKAYHEPGGGFSPSPGSFGVSLTLGGPSRSRIVTGDEVPVADIRQRYVWAADNGVPAIETLAPQYGCRWSMAADDVWMCAWWRLPGAANSRIGLLIRSVGPAGGPVEHLDWDGRQLIVNHRWVVCFPGAEVRVHLGNEQTPGWLTLEIEATSVQAPDGWGFARVEFAGESGQVTIRDTAPFFASPLTFTRVKSALELDLPDAAFASSLEAQAANLLMGFVGRQTCPGEPTNYPLAWERDGAYSVVAMARCGQVATAKQLAVYFADNDFFGGFGAEGDAPGSAINVLATVALVSGDVQFQKWCWPHVKRKLAYIEEMLRATEVIRKAWIGPLVPHLRGTDAPPVICQPARDGLIIGNMDGHFPALYINAMSYRGLRQAMRLAGALGVQNEVGHLPEMAERLRAGWEANLSVKEFQNERTYMTGLWPTWITQPAYEPYRSGLQQRWEGEHQQGQYPTRPLWTYFTVAEAHQWLFLDRPDNVWKTLRYFWDNQCSPGLYTYWEGEKEENSFDLWPHLRGWVAPKHVTPHYWTAAEMLLLQVDMLGYVAESGPEPVVLVGGGVPATWRSRPMRVSGLPTIVGVVGWEYDGRELHVTLRGKRPYPVRAGAGFGADVRVSAEHIPA